MFDIAVIMNWVMQINNLSNNVKHLWLSLLKALLKSLLVAVLIEPSHLLYHTISVEGMVTKEGVKYIREDWQLANRTSLVWLDYNVYCWFFICLFLQDLAIVADINQWLFNFLDLFGLITNPICQIGHNLSLFGFWRQKRQNFVYLQGTFWIVQQKAKYFLQPILSFVLVDFNKLNFKPKEGYLQPQVFPLFLIFLLVCKEACLIIVFTNQRNFYCFTILTHHG